MIHQEIIYTRGKNSRLVMDANVIFLSRVWLSLASYHSPAADMCSLSNGWTVETTTPQLQYFVSTQSVATANCGSCPVTKVGDPISPADGNVAIRETDIPAPASPPIWDSFQQ